MTLDLPSAQTLLLPAILFFYLFDAALLLYADEVVFARSGKHWHVVLGEGGQWSGRSLVLPRVMSPGTPLLRVAWKAGPACGDAVPVVQLLAVVAPLRWHARVLAVALFAGVPAALYFHPGPLWLLGLLGVIYLPTLVAVLYLSCVRQQVGLDRRQLAGIAFDVLACPPFALNLVSRVTLRKSPAQGALDLAPQLLTARGCIELQRAIAHRRAQLQEMIDIAADNGDGPSR